MSHRWRPRLGATREGRDLLLTRSERQPIVPLTNTSRAVLARPPPTLGGRRRMTRRPVKESRPDGAFVFTARGLRRAPSAPTRSYERACGWLEGWCQLRTLPALPLILLFILVVIVPLAYASPTDPIWIAGISEDDDVLDVVMDSNAVGDFGATIAVQGTVAVQPLSIAVARLALSLVASYSSNPGRAGGSWMSGPANRLRKPSRRAWTPEWRVTRL